MEGAVNFVDNSIGRVTLVTLTHGVRTSIRTLKNGPSFDATPYSYAVGKPSMRRAAAHGGAAVLTSGTNGRDPQGGSNA